VAVILNVDADHLDFFSGIDDIKSSFRKFAELVPDSGRVVANIDDENTMAALEGTAKKVVTFGLSGKADMRAENITLGKKASFDMLHKGAFLAHVELRVGGRHNIYNALAAAAAALELGAGAEHIKAGLESFAGPEEGWNTRGAATAPTYTTTTRTIRGSSTPCSRLRRAWATVA
jgi:UDP-N-acetylmuramate--alanine ligase